VSRHSRPTAEYAALALITAAFTAANLARLGPFSFSNVEVAAFTTGAWSVWLLVRNSWWTWPVGIANGALFVWVFADARLYADATINCWYVVAGFWGWWYWHHAGGTRRERPITSIGPRESTILVIALVVTTWWMTGHLASIGDSAPFWDALTSALSIVAFYMQGRRLVENWYLWIAADLIYIPLYLAKGLPLTCVLYVLFLGMCLVGVRDWRRDKAPTPPPVVAIEGVPA
jgi:nicotinamide mononucleotide transporter